jgi:hypothetical protein
MHFGKSSYPEFLQDRFNKKMDSLRKLSSSIKNLDSLLDEICDLNDSDILERLMNAYDLKNEIYQNGVFRNDFFNSHLMVLAKKNLQPPLMPHISTKIVYLRLVNDYTFFEYFYYMNTGTPLSAEDMANIYYGGLGERVMLLLDKFDESETTPPIDEEFFKVLKEVKWQRQSKKVFYKILLLLDELESNYHFFTMFKSEETLFVPLLCFCSAASDNRTLVSEEDVVKGFKTYIKLMKSDVTKYKAKNELIEPPGYLVCDKCGSYYQLQPGESPDDFEDTCECGGKIEYYENPDYVKKYNESSLYRFLKMDTPGLFLKLWGIVFMIMGILAIYGHFTQIKFPLLLPIGIFFTISGILPFIKIHKAINIYYTLIILSMGIFSFTIGAYLPGITFTILSIIILQNTWKIKP